MIERIVELASHLPFILMVNGKPRMNTVRIVEIAIFAAIFGGIVYSELGYLKASISELKADIKDIKRDLYAPNGNRDNWGTRPDRTTR